MSDNIKVTTADDVTVVTIANPEKKNAMTPEMRRYIGEVLTEVMLIPDSRVIIITGEAGNFSSGADVSQMKENPLPRLRAIVEEANHAIRAIVTGPKPVIAAVEGVAAGAGMSLALACDMVVAASNARFIASFIKVGLVPDMGLTFTLPQRVGARLAKRIVTLAETIDGTTGEKIGLVDQVTEPGGTMAAALALAKRYTAMAPLSLAFAKALFANPAATLEEGFRAEINYQPMLRQTRDHKEAAAAFLEKRAPKFTGY